MIKIVEGNVDRSTAHFELRYGDYQFCAWDDMLPVALLGKKNDDTIIVQYLINEQAEDNQKILGSVKGQIQSYLVEKDEPNPWEYAIYHCGTSANAYSHVRWSYFPTGWDFSEQTELNL